MPIADTCSSCGTRLIDRGSATFTCPGCGEEPLGRCGECRDQGVHYQCRKCRFTGP